VLGAIVILAIALVAVLYARYGDRGEPFPDRSHPAERPFSELEVVAELDRPPGNVAVSADGRVFITFHPDGRPTTNVAEIVRGRARPYPDRAWQSEREEPFFHSPLSLRIDRQNRLWVLDHAEHGSGEPSIYAFDLASNELVHEHHFSSDIAPLGSHLNDFAVTPEGDRIFIADASIFGKSPALIVYDTRRKRARRVLAEHRSVMPDLHFISVEGEPQVKLGIFTIRPGVDSIALDRRGEWLYYAAVTSNHFWRIPAADLANAELTSAELAGRVERLGEKTMSDGITIDDADTIYVSDPEHSAVHTFDREGRIRTLLRDRRLRWPDGFSFGPNGDVYFTCSSLQHVILASEEEVAAHAPYHVFRFASGATAPPGH
jgi:sugar lactone lactonase YvrE